MASRSCPFFLLLLLIAFVASLNAQSDSPVITSRNFTIKSTSSSTGGDNGRMGRCPTNQRDPSRCPTVEDPMRVDECESDIECGGESKCCSDGCRRLCVLPILTSCERQRVETQKRARALELNGVNDLQPLPKCDPLGDFEPVQCDPLSGNCFCVDESGFELAGTRARSLDLVNCTSPKPCAGLLCRMLCPYEFELDQDGCPLCQCRDPCRGIRCPGSQTCQLEEMPCAKEPCPPVPTCKQARSVESICPSGIPLMMSGNVGTQRPFICGNAPGQPQCPKHFNCLVQPGADYGACCAPIEQLIKPGTCPATDDSDVCGVPCQDDTQCLGADKCCHSNGCGKHCIPPRNVSLCMQQQAIAELLSATERAGMGYVPQCDDDSNFARRQCSRNGLVCWCVDSLTGAKLKGSMGASEEVSCDDDNLPSSSNLFTSRSGGLRGISNDGCGPAPVCSSASCDYGFKTDVNGCPTCQCDDPCLQLACPEGKECVMRPENCTGRHCPLHPQCRPVFVPPCAFGQHLTNEATGEAVDCSHHHTPNVKFACPSNYHCSYSIPNNASYCCPQQQVTVAAKEHPDQGRLQSICEMYREISHGRRLPEPGHHLVIKQPRCNELTGEFEEVQCDDDVNECWCVDEFGIELSGTRSKQPEGKDNRLSSGLCLKLRHDTESECPGLLCRLGCDYGFAIDNVTQCPVCECRNPCEVTTCPEAGQECQLIVTQCAESPFCPALPFCVDVQQIRRDGTVLEEDDVISCPNGDAYINGETNETLICNPRSRALSCPDGYTCYSADKSAQGACCPVQHEVKAGQCPYLVPVSVDSCDNECTADEDCDGQLKCCSNGCGTQCVEPLLKTACQHEQMIMKYRARESGKPASRLFIPRCRPEDGAYEPVQCDPVTKACWCVSSDGRELAGTRVPPGLQPQCHKAAQLQKSCPAVTDCPIRCPHGYHLDTSGCPVCQCHDPCQNVQCRSSEGEECRLVQVNCIRQPCPPLPVCLPRLENPCSYGHPLTDGSNETMTCGPMGSTCPSTHKCQLSPLGEFAVCCPKPRDVCMQERALGSCKSSILRYSFNERRNKCEPFRFGGCGGNANNFESERDCKAVCPQLSGCEQLREKNLKMAEKFKKVVFAPRCDKETGDWQAVQCLEEVGICWCVDKDGEHVKGSLTRGQPICGVRQARQRTIDPPICEETGATVHVCSKSVCENKICLADPKAVCRVDPCGGCRHAFYDPITGRKVDCQAGLSTCQQELQTVLNSPAWTQQQGAQQSEVDAEIVPEVRPKRSAETLAATQSATIVQQQLVSAGVGPTELLAALALMQIDPESDQETLQQTELSPPVTEYTTPEETTPLPPREAKLIDEGLYDGSVKNEFETDDSDIEQVEEVLQQKPVPALRDAIKPGFCPPVRSRTFLRVLAQFAGGSACADQCISDADCGGTARCCPGECGASCAQPVLLPTPLLPKPGACPAQVAHPFGCPVNSEDEQRPANQCSMDVDCSGRSKCCFDGCSSTCSQPEEGSANALMVSVSPPVCTLKGDYAREQSHGELSWCVDTEGRPIDESFTRGSVRCSPSGTVLEQRALGPVCADPAVQPQVCRHQCLEAKCPHHPDAVCVADPCDNCRVSFIDRETGHKVHCVDRCSQPVETGHCRAMFPRYAFNATSQRCEEFVYGGCSGNDNNFDNLEECQDECQKPVNVCELPVETGLCRANMPRWFYNAETQKCEQFTFGGCGGNANNFYSKQQCENRCPDLVLCPAFLSASGAAAASSIMTGETMAMMSSCSRNEACRGQTCHGQPEASCSVDPCSCRPIFRDADGTEVQCLPQPIEELQDEDVIVTNGIESRHAVVADLTTTTTTTSTTTTTTTTTPRGKSLQSNHFTRCQKTRAAQLSDNSSTSVVECDHLGRYQPVQCFNNVKAQQQQPIKCWCVDEAGDQVVNSTIFNRGEHTCRLVPVAAVAVTLGFPAMDHGDGMMEMMANEVRQQVGQILNGLSARTYEPDLSVKTLEDGTLLSFFTLVGENKIDVASHLEDMVKSGHLSLEMDGHTMAANAASAKFHHKLDSILNVADIGDSQTTNVLNDRSLETREILAQALDIEAPYLAIIVVLSVLASILVCGLVIGLVLHRRRTTGTYPKGAGSTLASPPKNKGRKKSADYDRTDIQVVPRGFPRVGITPADVIVQTPQLSPTVPRSKRLNRNADAW